MAKSFEYMLRRMFSAGGEESEYFLVDFLNALLRRHNSGGRITDILQTEVIYDLGEGHGERLELRVNTISGEREDIAFHINNRRGSLRKGLFFWSEFYIRMHEDDPTLDVNKWTLFNLCDHNFLPQTKEYRSVFKLGEEAGQIAPIADIELHFIELAKWQPDATAELNAEGRWLQFLTALARNDQELCKELADASLIFELATEFWQRELAAAPEIKPVAIATATAEDMAQAEGEEPVVELDKKTKKKLRRRKLAEERYEVHRQAMEKYYQRGWFF